MNQTSVNKNVPVERKNIVIVIMLMCNSIDMTLLHMMQHHIINISDIMERTLIVKCACSSSSASTVTRT